MDTVIQRFIKTVNEIPEKTAQLSKDSAGEFHPTSYGELLEKVKIAAAGFHTLGVKRGDPVGFICDNRPEWAVCDFALLALGSYDVPRGCDIMGGPMAQILGIPECEFAILENELQLEKLLAVKKELPKLRKIILIDSPADPAETRKKGKDFEIKTYEEIVTAGKAFQEENPGFIEEEAAKGSSSDLATIIFTSGTTGDPKGVMLTNESYVLQAEGIHKNIHITEDEVWMTILPIWHSFERAINYIVFLNKNTVAYSKPIGQVLIQDFGKVKPSMMTAVPRVWEALYNGIMRNVKAKGTSAEKLLNFFLANAGRHEWLKRKITGRNFQYRRPFPLVNQIVYALPYALLTPIRALGNILLFNKVKESMFPNWFTGISGGGALQPRVDQFFAAAGISLMEGYGLTESGPIISAREAHNPVSGGVGVPLPAVEIKVVDVEDGDKPLKPGERGVLMVKSAQVMTGYYGKPDLTAKVIRNGWLDTGDIVVLDRRDNIAIVGRAKDTIVLLGGENIEPVPLEQKICESPYIDAAVVLGQDSKYLSALIVPNFELVEEYAKKNNITYGDTSHVGDVPEIQELMNGEIAALISAKNNFAPFERIYKFTILHESFEVGRELSSKMELLRPTIYKLYKTEIEELTRS
ncbi:MAG: AMP-binding protein [Spirochaetales bacterium]|nr:AMP-binding protein [Spirochaetales bacterium]